MYKTPEFHLLSEVFSCLSDPSVLDILLKNQEAFRYLKEFKSGETILYQKDPAKYLYFLLRGQCIIMNQISWSPNDIINFVQPPHILGLSECLNNDSLYNAFVVAKTNCVIFQMKTDDFLHTIQSNADLCYHTLITLGQMFSQNLARAETRQVFHPKDCLGYYLYLHAQHSLPYVCPITRANLALELNINLRTLYRYIDALKTDKYLTLKRGKMIVEKRHFATLSERYSSVIL